MANRHSRRNPDAVDVVASATRLGTELGIGRAVDNGQGSLLRRHGQLLCEPPIDAERQGVLLAGYRLEDATVDEAGVNAVDADVLVPVVLEEASLELREPHLEVELVVSVAIAGHAFFSVKVFKVEFSVKMAAGGCADDAGVGALCDGGEEDVSEEYVGEKIDLIC